MSLFSFDALSFISLTVIIVTLFFVFTLRKTISNSHGVRVRAPPGPLALPIIGHIHLLKTWFLPESLRKLSSRFGPLMTTRIGSNSFVVVSNADVAAQVFKTHDVAFSSRPGGASSGGIVKNKGGSFFAADYGTYWKFAKKLCMSEVLSATRVAELADIRKQEISCLLDTLLEHSREERACDLTIPIMAMSNNIISRMVMGTRTSSDAVSGARVAKLVEEFSRFASKVMLGGMFDPFRNLDYFRYRKRFGEAYMQYVVMADRIITEHEKEGNESRRKDLIDTMLEMKNDKSAPVVMSRANITAITLDLFMGGTGSVASQVKWILAELINHPRVLKKVRDEIESVVVGSERLVDEKDIKQLPYLQAVVKEGLRLHPLTAIITRRCTQHCKINGYDVLPDTKVLVNVYAIMRDPEHWNDPGEFIPERFMVDNDSSSSAAAIGGDWTQRVNASSDNFEYIPFGGGRRRCPGAGLASAIIHVAIASLVQCFDWKLKSGLEKVDMEEAPGFSTEMARPMDCYPIARHHILPSFN